MSIAQAVFMDFFRSNDLHMQFSQIKEAQKDHFQYSEIDKNTFRINHVKKLK